MNGRYMRESAELQVSRLSSGTLATILREITEESDGNVKYSSADSLQLELLQEAHSMEGAETWQEVVRHYKKWRLIVV